MTIQTRGRGFVKYFRRKEMFVKNIFLGPYPSPSRREVAYTEENLHEMDELISTESKNGGKRILNTNSSARRCPWK